VRASRCALLLLVGRVAEVSEAHLLLLLLLLVVAE
jgi:hypothetical protein